jgi:hypothetical protein
VSQPAPTFSNLRTGVPNSLIHQSQILDNSALTHAHLFLQKKIVQGSTLWQYIRHYQQAGKTETVHRLLHTAFTLDDHIETGISLSGINIKSNLNESSDMVITSTALQFYSSPALHHNQVKYTQASITKQVLQYCSPNRHPSNPNKFHLLTPMDLEHSTNDQPSTQYIKSPSKLAPATQFWVQDTSLSTIADLINQQLQHDKMASITPPSESDKLLGEEQDPQQHFRFNLVRHRGATSSLKTIDLFKGFVTALKLANPLLVVLPYSASKQHYTPISSKKQVQTLDKNKMLQYFQPYYRKQMFSLSGYFHIKTSISYNNLIHCPQVEEWLDSHCYSLKMCSSQTEEMVQLAPCALATCSCTEKS